MPESERRDSSVTLVCEAASTEVAAATRRLAAANVCLPSAEARLRWLSGACAALTFALGCMVLVGWEAHIPWLKSVLPRFVTMRPLTAASFALGGIALALLLIGGRARTVGRVVGTLLVLDGLGALLEYALGTDLHFDRFVFGRGVVDAGGLYPGRLSLDAAAALVLLGVAFLVSRPRRSLVLRDLLAAVASMVAGVVALGYAYGATPLYGVAPFAMALHTAVGFLLLSIGLLLEAPRRGLLRMLVHRTVGGVVARRLIPLTTLLPFALGLALVVVGPRLGRYDLKLGAALLVALLVATFTVVILWNASALERIDLQRQLADERLRRATDVVSALTDATLRRLPVRDLLVGLCERVKKLFDADTASILLADEPHRELVVAASVGLQSEVEATARVPFGHGIAGRIFSSGTPMIIPDLSQIETLSPVLRAHIRSMLGAPLIAPDGRIIGVIDVGTSQHREFSDREMRLMVLAADRLAQGVTLAKLQDDLRNERSRLQTILTSAAHGLVFIDAIDGHLEANPAAEEISGQAMTGRRLDDISIDVRHPGGSPLTPDEWPGVRALHGESVSGVETIVVHADGTRLPVLTSATPVRGPGGEVTGAVLAYQDISVLKELERLRDEFASIVAHDLRNPISSILMNVEVLLREAHGRPAVEVRTSSLERIRRAGARLGDMVKDLLDASRIDVARLVLDRKPILSTKAVEAIVDQVRPTLGEHPVKLATEGEPAPIFVDPLRFDQIVTNLLENAAKYSPKEAPIDVKVAPSQDGVEVSVKDEGMGIRPEEIPLLFDRFYQSKRAREMKAGLGLGLYIARGLVEAHGGRIWVESEPAHGSTFHVWLPSAPAHPGQPGT